MLHVSINEIGSNSQHWENRRRLEVNAGVLRSAGVMFLGKEERRPQLEERADTPEIHEGPGQVRSE